MQSVTRTIAVSTALSIILHGVAFAAVLLVHEQVVTLAEGVGKSVEIQLISATMDSDQQETDVPRKQEIVQKDLPENLPVNLPKNQVGSLINRPSQNIVASLAADQSNTLIEPDDKTATWQRNITTQKPALLSEGENSAQLLQSTNASLQQHSILELLHARISNNKEYPYIARRQRREGVATITFVLYPDGKIENAYLLNSSRTLALDRAALSAVKQIEPFTAARDYLKQSKKFQVDVEFNLL